MKAQTVVTQCDHGIVRARAWLPVPWRLRLRILFTGRVLAEQVIDIDKQQSEVHLR